ncbi:MAG: hypothetical protein GF346_06905 [Candidatus Eisenbacteria bacterium]|nr:hypothetical protein [Candidatus Latescibacterota bacterium]MBD3302158.1 hypothetical protein [Candidatus Eisenbacteria bacterium]
MLGGRPIGGDRLVRIQKILWAVFLGSIFFYLAAALLVIALRSPADSPASSLPTLRLALVALAVAEWIGSFWLRRLLLVRAFAEEPIRWGAVLGAFVFGWGFQESIALIGLVLVLLGGTLLEALLLCAGSFLGILLMPPAPGWLRARLSAEASNSGESAPP